jgi:hypothetical protein
MERGSVDSAHEAIPNSRHIGQQIRKHRFDLKMTGLSAQSYLLWTRARFTPTDFLEVIAQRIPD